LRPALNKKTSASPPPSPKNVGQGGAEIDHDLAQMVNHTSGEVAVGKLQLPIKPMLIIVSALAVCLIVFTVVLARTPNVIAPASVPTKEISAPEVTTSTQALAIESKVVTGGPSPFDPNAWAVRIQLSATGGNGSYIFWVNSQHLPEASADQFTVDGKGCTAEKPWVGVTSGGEAVSQQLVISSPLSNCPTP
jgi:hypothetical protein